MVLINCYNLKESEKDHGLVQNLLHLDVCQTLHTFLKLVVNKERQELRTSLVQVQEVFKITGDNLSIGDWERVLLTKTENLFEVFVVGE